MKTNRLLAVACAASLLAAAGCSSGSDDNGGSGGNGGNGGNGGSTSASQGGGKAEPSNGVLPNADPMPMPVAGKRYDNPQPRDNVKQGGTLTLPLPEIPPNFNSWSVDGNSVYNNQVEYWTDNPSPWDFTVGGDVSPDKDYLSKVELVKKDPETVKVTINKKAKWNNGDPITWKAVETAWKTQSGDKKYNPASTDGFSNIKSVKKGASDKEAVVTFKTPTYPYQLAIGLENPKNLDPTFYKKGWVNKPHNELRAGPYKIKSSSKSKLVLVPNENWWGPKPKLDKIVYKQMEDTASINAFQNGEIDATSVGNADRLKQVKDMKGIRIERGFQTATFVYTLGQDSPLFKHDYARKAFEVGTDRKTLAKIRFQGMDWKETPPGSSLFYPWQDAYQDNMKQLHYDPDKAKKLMESNGWKMGDDGYFQKGGKTAEFTYVDFGDDPTGAAMARAQQQMSKKVGLKMTIDNRKSSEFSKTLTKKDFDVVSMGWSGSDPFGWFWVCQIYCSDSASNYSGLGNKALDKKLKKPQTVSDLKTAAKLGNEAEAEALKLGGTFPLYNGPTMYAVKTGLANTNNAFSSKVSGFYSAAPYNVGWQK